MKPRDVERLSAYLDGQLSPSESARLEARLKTDRDLVSVMEDLRGARNLLRQLPQRRAPRNFTLTRKMVGQNPPLPRSYPLFRFATALATLLFFLTYGLNFLAPQFRPATGMGGGGGNEEVQMFSAEAPAPAMATEAPAEEPAQAPAATEPPASESALAPAPTMTAPPMATAEDTARVIETPAAKNGEDAGNALAQKQPQAPQETQKIPPLVPSMWQYILLAIAFTGALFMVVIRRVTIRHWK